MVKPGERILPAPASARAPGGALRAGRRIAGLGATALAAARRARPLRGGTSGEAMRARAALLRETLAEVTVRHGIELRPSGPVPHGPVLLVANHQSYLDPVVIGSMVPCVPISKASVAGWPVIGGLARDLGVLFVVRGDPRSGSQALRGAAEAFGEGVAVLNFPEGTTTTGERVLPFQPGLFGLALRAGVPVVPVALSYGSPRAAWVGDDTFLPHYLHLAAEPALEVRIRFGTAIAPPCDRSATALAREGREQVCRMLGLGDATAVGA
jgi:1-acyl-sn-glycerol-3-phosphate acyltransferase